METEESTLSPSESTNVTESFLEAALAEEEHEFDAISALVLNITIIGCLLLAYYVKKYQIYYLPESAGALLVGIIIGGIARLSTNRLELFEFVSFMLRSLHHYHHLLLNSPNSIDLFNIHTVTRGILLFPITTNYI